MIKHKLNISDLFQTQELALAAALVAWNFPLDSVDKTNKNKATFIFLRSSDLDTAIQSFWNNEGQVSPKTYFYALREVKSRIHGE